MTGQATELLEAASWTSDLDRPLATERKTRKDVTPPALTRTDTNPIPILPYLPLSLSPLQF